MRLRRIAAWLLVPSLVLVAAASWFVERSVSSERKHASALAAVALRGEALDLASASATSEIVILIGLDAFTTVPLDLQLYEASGASMRAELDPSQLLTSLAVTEGEGSKALARLDEVGDTSEAVRDVLRPIDEAVRTRLAGGDRAMIDPSPYATAAAWLRDQSTSTDTRAADSAAELASLAQRRSYWRSATFGGFALVLVLVAVVGAMIALARVAASARRLHDRIDIERARAEQLHERSERFRRLIGMVPQLTIETGTASLASALVTETRALVGGDVVALMLRDTSWGETSGDGASLRPLVTVGDVVTGPIGLGDGVVAQCVSTGMVTRLIVPFDAAFPAEPGPLSVISAPLVADGVVIGAVVAATRGTLPFDENDEVAMQLIALVAAGAVQSAQRFDSTVALSLNDPLTGLANRRRLDQDLASISKTSISKTSISKTSISKTSISKTSISKTSASEMSTSKTSISKTSASEMSTAGPVAFLMIDVDHFKAFNDRHGHVAGDRLLQRVTAAISSAVRESDVVYRYGGEEFSVLLPATDPVVAMTVAERVRVAVATAAPPEGTEPVTVSVGVAAMGVATGDAAHDVTALVAAADAALYDAKQAGRDRVMLAP